MPNNNNNTEDSTMRKYIGHPNDEVLKSKKAGPGRFTIITPVGAWEIAKGKRWYDSLNGWRGGAKTVWKISEAGKICEGCYADSKRYAVEFVSELAADRIKETTTNTTTNNEGQTMTTTNEHETMESKVRQNRTDRILAKCAKIERTRNDGNDRILEQVSEQVSEQFDGHRNFYTVHWHGKQYESDNAEQLVDLVLADLEQEPATTNQDSTMRFVSGYEKSFEKVAAACAAARIAAVAARDAAHAAAYAAIAAADAVHDKAQEAATAARDEAFDAIQWMRQTK